MTNLTVALAILAVLLCIILAFVIARFQTRLAEAHGLVAESNRSANPRNIMPSLKDRFGDWYQDAPMGFHTLDATGTITDINETELTWLGYTRDEVVGKMHISRLLTEKSKEILRNAASRPQTYGGSGYLEYEAVRKDGTIMHILAYDLPFKNAQGTILGYYVADVDISQRKVSEEKLLLSESNFARAQTLAKVGHYEIALARDNFSGQTYWSDEIFSIFGRDKAYGPMTLAETVDQCIHPDERAFANQSIRETFQGNDDTPREIRIVRPDGSIRHLRGIARLSAGNTTHPSKLFGVIQDITDLKIAQEKVARGESRFRAMIEKSDETIALFSEDAMFLYASPSIAALLGYPPEVLLGKKVWDHIHPDDCPRVANELAGIINLPNSSIVSQFRAKNKSGDWRWVEAAETNRLQDPDINAIIANVRDITVRKNMETALAQSNARLRQLSAYLEEIREKERADVAQALHDEVGQHYAGLQMGIHWLEQRHKEDALSVERTTLMRQLMTRAFATIRNIIQSLHPPMLDDLGLAGALEALVEDVTQHSGLQIEFVCAAPCEVLAKTHQLALFRGLQEALTNVSRHANASHVKVKLECDAVNVKLTIADNGGGMSASAREKRGSFGLFGMSERINALGGTIEVSSQPDAGTTIHLSVPWAAHRLLEQT